MVRNSWAPGPRARASMVWNFLQFSGTRARAIVYMELPASFRAPAIATCMFHGLTCGAKSLKLWFLAKG